MRKCKVFVHKNYAGMLKEHSLGGEYEFAYDPQYLLMHTDPVCLAMPLRDQPYRSPYLFPFFANMLSEGANRELQSAYLHIDKDDDFGILLETAQFDTPGAVTVMPINNDDQ